MLLNELAVAFQDTTLEKDNADGYGLSTFFAARSEKLIITYTTLEKDNQETRIREEGDQI